MDPLNRKTFPAFDAHGSSRTSVQESDPRGMSGAGLVEAFSTFAHLHLQTIKFTGSAGHAVHLRTAKLSLLIPPAELLWKGAGK